MRQRSFKGGRSVKLGGLAIVAGIVVACGWLGYQFSAELPGFSQFSASVFRIRVEGYPVRIALGAPRRDMSASRSATSHDHSPKAVNDAEPGQAPGATADMPMRLPVDEAQRESEAFAAEQPGGDAPRAADGSTRILKVNFSIAAGVREDAIDARKTINIDNVDMGVVSIKISGDSDIFINTRDLIAISGGKLDDNAMMELKNSEYMNVNELRSLGLVIRYDAVRDRMLLSSGST